MDIRHSLESHPLELELLYRRPNSLDIYHNLVAYNNISQVGLGRYSICVHLNMERHQGFNSVDLEPHSCYFQMVLHLVHLLAIHGYDLLPSLLHI